MNAISFATRSFSRLLASETATLARLESGGLSGQNAGDVRFAVGARVGKYEIRRVLGQGGQARAYLAFDPDLERLVVIKFYFEAEDPDAREDVLKEGRALAAVRSPFVAQCLGAEEHEGMPYLVLEYVPGRTLSEVLGERRIAIADALRLVERVAAGLEAVHRGGLVHRDVKPANIILGEDGVPRLVDFGMAEPVRCRRTSQLSGTVAYMSPEQARGESERIGPASDVFGLGAVLYEILTGAPPYRGNTVVDVLRAARAGEVISPRRRRRRLAPEVEALVLRALARDPQERFADAGEFRRAIRDLRNSTKSGWRGFGFSFGFGKRRFRVQFGTTIAMLAVATCCAGASTFAKAGSLRRVETTTGTAVFDGDVADLLDEPLHLRPHREALAFRTPTGLRVDATA